MSTYFDKAAELIPLGVSSPLRACRNVNSKPVFVRSAKGETLTTEDGRMLIDFVYGFGPIILGHSDKQVTKAICEAASSVCVTATANVREVELAETIVSTADHLEQLRFVSTGTEAVMSALKLARAFTKRTRILRFKGGYHGHADLVNNATEESWQQRGLDPAAMAANLVIDVNDVDLLETTFARCGDQLAAVIVEPLLCNASIMELEPDFLVRLRELCDKHGTVLIFDEVITGFRFTFGPYSNLLPISPDISVFGKIVGGGLPIGAYGARREIMSLLEQQQVFQGGTFSGNPVSMAAGQAVLTQLRNPKIYADLKRKVEYLSEKVHSERPASCSANLIVKGGALAFQFAGRNRPARNFKELSEQNGSLYEIVYKDARANSIHLAPDCCEVMFVSRDTTYESLDLLADSLVASFHKIEQLTRSTGDAADLVLSEA